MLIHSYSDSGFIANRVKGFTYKPIVIDSDIMTRVQLAIRGKTVLSQFGVYLSHYNGYTDQIELHSGRNEYGSSSK